MPVFLHFSGRNKLETQIVLYLLSIQNCVIFKFSVSVFLKFRKFQPQNSYKIYPERKKECYFRQRWLGNSIRINFKKTVCQHEKMHILSSLRSERLESSFCTKIAARAKNVPSSFNKLARPETFAFPLATQAVIGQLRNVIHGKTLLKQYPLNGK